MDATRNLGGCRLRAFAVKIEPVLPLLCSPTFFEVLYVLAVLDAESREGQDQGANANVRLRAFSDAPKSRTP